MDLRFKISDPNYVLLHVHIVYMVWALLAASEATTASKQPRRSKLSLQVKLVTPIYYMTKFQGIFISQKMTLLHGDKQDPLTCVAIAAGKKEIDRGSLISAKRIDIQRRFFVDTER